MEWIFPILYQFQENEKNQACFLHIDIKWMYPNAADGRLGGHVHGRKAWISRRLNNNTRFTAGSGMPGN